MIKLIETIEKIISDHVQLKIEARSDSEVRMVLHGFPLILLENLFRIYDLKEGLQIPNHDPIRVLLVADEIDEIKNAYCARCTPEDVVSNRNVRQTILILLPVGNHLNLSTSSAAAFIGLAPATIKGEKSFYNDPFVKIILEELRNLSKISNQDWDRISKIIKFAFDDWSMRGDADRSHSSLDECWNLLGKLFEVGDNYKLLIARCGLPNSSNSEVGTKDHLEVLGKLAKFIESNGFTSAREILLNEADAHLQSHIKDFFESLFLKKCESPLDFSKSPVYFYSQEKVPTEWWNVLDLDVWLNLLQQTKPVKTESFKVECLNPIVEVAKGLPWVVQDYPTFKIRMEEKSPNESILVYRGNGRSPKYEAKFPTNEEWIPDEVPVHSSAINYKFFAGDEYKPSNVRIISLENYSPGVIVFSRDAKKITLPKKKKAKASDKIDIWECDLDFSYTGTYMIELLLSSDTIISDEAEYDDTLGEDIKEAEIGKDNLYHRLFLAETDQESTYIIKVENPHIGAFLLHVNFHAENEEFVGVSSVFEALVLDNVKGKSSVNSVEINRGCRIYDLERKILDDPFACFPLIISDDYTSKMTSDLNWKTRPLLTSYSCENDVRPEFKNWKVPDQFIQVRSELLAYLNEKMSGDELLIELYRLDQSMLEEEFRELVKKYLQAYENWIQSDYESGILCDAYMVVPREGNTTGLSNEPEAILISPLHPIKLAWHCLSQSILAETAYKKTRCPAAGIINPHSVPDIMHVPCIQPGGKSKIIPFMAIRSSSPYWGVLWNGNKLSGLNDSSSSGIWADEAWGISISSISNGFNKAQVKRAVSDVRDIRIAKSTILISIISDTLGTSSCNEGIIEWCEENLGDVDKDEWASAGARKLDVLDMREASLYPSAAVIADLTDKTDAKVRWWLNQENKIKNDLCIVENLGVHLPYMTHGHANSPIGMGGLIRNRVRRHIDSSNGSQFIQESRAGKYYGNHNKTDELESHIGSTLAIMENMPQSGENLDMHNSFVFTPSLDTIIKSFNQSAYCALSSSSIDSSCFFGRHGNAFLWDYDLPNYSNISGESNGFYLLVRENPTLISSIRAAIEEFEKTTSNSFTDSEIQNIVVEISRRGMPTLKRIAAGGAAATGEFGVLVTMRLLQDSFIEGTKNGCLIPVKQIAEKGSRINLIIPMDPFQSQLDSLKRASEGSGVSFRRPDLILFSIALNDFDIPLSIKITPVEIKARTSEFSKEEMLSAIDQAKSFSSYIKKLLFRKEDEDLGRLWDLAIKDFLSSLISFGFRVYGVLEDLGNDKEEWAKLHERVIGGIFAESLNIEIDEIGRLVVVDKSAVSRSFDADGDGFDEVIVLTATDALDIFRNDSETLISKICSKVDDWKFVPHDEISQFVEIFASSKDLQSPILDEADRDFRYPDEDQRMSIASDEEFPYISDYNAADTSNDNQVEDGIKFKIGKTINGFSQFERDFWPSNTNLNQINIGIVGDLGTGKTQLTKALIYQMVKQSSLNREHSPRFLIFDYKDDYSSRDFVDAVGAKVIEPFDIPLNMFDVSNCTNRKPWIERHKFFTDVLSKIYGGIGQVQQLNIKNAVKAAYKKAADMGNNSPTLEQVYQEYLNVTNGKPDSPTNILSDLIDMEIFETDYEKLIPFDDFMDGVVVIRLSALGQDDNTKNLLVVIFLNFFYEYMLKLEKKPFVGHDPQLRFINSMLLVDEADSIMKYEFDVLRKILLQGREFGVGVLLSSQYLSHFKKQETNYLEPLLTWFIHKVPNITIKELESIGLTRANNETLYQIRSLNPHECLFKTLDVNGDFIRATPFYKLIAGDD
ncbi:type IV secretion system DNA-binding domain-containing protein [uncultured Sphaerochaeta sp.]|uniref:type IV secretion system DNA-binding domain-containing protein n=1 Tax=uncultured Sphaerochaeta sp. TaxID=886478 RepID=UPI0029CA3361|nr:type IV secretion system DNA-binding domain-containing protein [uncultured Sphaerochaeta sp.]